MGNEFRVHKSAKDMVEHVRRGIERRVANLRVEQGQRGVRVFLCFEEFEESSRGEAHGNGKNFVGYEKSLL